MPAPEPEPPEKSNPPEMNAIQQKAARDAELVELKKNPDLHLLFGKDLERMEAESYLASGGKVRPDGFDIASPEVRARLMDCPKEEFVDFEVNPLPEILQRDMDNLPEDWQYRQGYADAAEALCQKAEKVIGIQPWMYVSLDAKSLWVCRIPGKR